MKRCPVCQTMVFKDMPVCYGCLHRFPEGDDPIGEGAIDAEREEQALESEFDWILRFEMKCPDEPARSWFVSLGREPKLLAA